MLKDTRMADDNALPTTAPARGTMTALLFHLQQAYLAVQEAQDEVRRCTEAAHAFYGDAQWTKARAITYQAHHQRLQNVMDDLAAQGHQLQKGDDV